MGYPDSARLMGKLNSGNHLRILILTKGRVAMLGTDYLQTTPDSRKDLTSALP